MKIKLHPLTRVALHSIVGALIGYLVLHPVSMLIYYDFEQPGLSTVNILLLSFSHHHFAMAAFFAFLGAFSGTIQGLYIQRIANLYEKVKKLSITDDLTTLHNRRYFFKRFEEELARAKRYAHELYLFMIDIDDFKHYNDKHGHQHGDGVLWLFGRYLRKSVRTSDIVARYGGEEFVIILPETNESMACKMANRLRAGIAKSNIFQNNNQSSKQITISIGITGYPYDAHDIDGLIKKADQALYRAKRKGKNRICRI